MRSEELESAMTEEKTAGDRIAKVMARAGVASRRDAERMIVEGRVAVNGKPVTSPALDVLPTDRVTLDGKPIDAPQAARLWLYYKPLGLVTSNKDEKGRQTVFDTLPQDMPRVMSVGRLDLNSEGLLLLTNDGALKRKLELPATGWLRKYRVRVNGRPNDATFDPLRRGVTIEGEDFLPMDISLDRQQGANAWLTVGLREGKNREIRRAMTEVGMVVNRLIRVSYGPFRLNTMKPGDVVEVKQKTLREQLGNGVVAKPSEGDAPPRSRGPRPTGAGRSPTGSGERKPYKPRGEGEGFARKPRAARAGGEGGPDRKPFRARGEGEGFDRKPRAPRAEGAGADRKTYAARGDGGPDRKPRQPRGDGERFDRKPRQPQGDREGFQRKPGRVRNENTGADRKPYASRDEGRADRKPQAPRGAGGPGHKPHGKDEGPERKPRPPRSEDAGHKPQAPRGDGGAGRHPRGPRPAGPGKSPRSGSGKPPRGPNRK